MAIKIVISEGKACPFVFCDQCNDRIADAGGGNYTWQYADAEKGAQKGGPLFFTHKKCVRQFEASHGDRDDWMWAPLSVLPINLAGNMRIGIQEAKDGGATIDVPLSHMFINY